MAREESTVLLVARGERMADALEQALVRRGLAVERATPERLVAAAFVVAPDLVVLAGEVAKDGGRRALTLLGEKPMTASVPVVLVSESGNLGERLEAFDHGVVAVVPRSASADDTAKRIAEIAADVPEQPGELRGLAAASVDELVALFASELRSGILSVAAGSDDVSAQVVLHSGRPVREAVEELVGKLKPLVQRGRGPLSYEFFEQASARLGSLDLGLPPDEAAPVFDGLRVVLVEQRAARSDVLAQELRAAGAEVVVADGAGVGLERARRLDPEVVILDGADVDGWALGAVRALRRDPHLRWASLLVVDEAQLWKSESRPDLAALAAAVAPLVEADRELAARATEGRAFGVRVEAVGPIRLLRALADTGLGLRLRLVHPKVAAQIDLAEGLVAGASARTSSGRRVEGPAALATFCAVGAGRVRVEPKDAPAATNVMAPVPAALAAADAERPLVRPSLPPPSEPPAPPAQKPTPADEKRVVAMLEALVHKLDRVVGEQAPAAPRPEAERGAAAAGAPGPQGAPEQESAERSPALDRPGPSAERAAPRPEAERGARGGEPDRAAGEPPSAAPAPEVELEEIGAAAVDHDGATGHYDPETLASLSPQLRRSDAPPPPPGAKLPPRGAPPASPAASAAHSASPAASAAPPASPAASAAPPGSPAASTAPPGSPAASRAASASPAASTAPPGSPAASTAPPGPSASSAAPPASSAASAVHSASPAAFAAPPGSPAASRAASASPAASTAPPGSPAASTAPPGPPAASAGSAEDGGPTSASEGREATLRLGTPDAWPGADGPSSGAAAPDLGPPELARAGPARRRGLLAAGALGLLGLLAAAGVVGWVALASDEPSEAAASSATSAEPEAGAHPASSGGATAGAAAEPAASPNPPAPRAPPASERSPSRAEPGGGADARAEGARAEAVLGPAGGEPLEGDEADFDLGAFGIEEAPPPRSRRRRARTLRELIRQANILRNRDQLDEAQELYFRILSLDPDSPRATAGMIRVFLARDDADNAILFAQRLVRLRPAFASNWVLLGDTFERGHNPDAALRAWTHALELQPRWRPARERIRRIGRSGADSPRE